MNRVDAMLNTSLLAACRGGYTNIVQLLLQYQVLVDYPYHFDCTALGVAVIRNHIDIVNLLLEAGADIAASNKSGLQILSVAMMKMHWDIVLLLLTKKPTIIGMILLVSCCLLILMYYYDKNLTIV